MLLQSKEITHGSETRRMLLVMLIHTERREFKADAKHTYKSRKYWVVPHPPPLTHGRNTLTNFFAQTSPIQSLYCVCYNAYAGHIQERNSQSMYYVHPQQMA